MKNDTSARLGVDSPHFPAQFLPDWVIPDDLRVANTRIITDDPETRDTSLTATLERKVSKSWMPKEYQEAIAFFSEDGEFFQLRYTCNPPLIDGKPQRYNAIANSGYKFFKPTVPNYYRQRIAASWSINPPDDRSFWGWVKVTAECPVYDAEGAAKALTLISLGYPAISGFGAFGGVQTSEYRTFKRPIGKRKSGKLGGFTTEKIPVEARLPQALAELAQVPRRFVLVPDMDTDPKTRRIVANAWLRRAMLLEKRGCQVRICYWDQSLGKGIDDVLRTHGAEATRHILDHPLTPKQYRLKIELSFELAWANATIDSRNMQLNAPELPKTGLVFSDAAVGTGKTKLAARETADRTVLAPYPLRSLAKAASEPLNADYRNEGKLNRNQGAYYSGEVLSDRLTIVYDSLKNLDITNQFAGELEDLLLDEVTHGLRHMLTGATCKADRLAIVEKFVEAVRTSKRILAFDADLTRVELDMLRELRPGETEFYLKNLRKPDPWEIQWLTLTGKNRNVGTAIEAITPQFPTTGLIHWACDSRKTSEKIAAYLESKGLKCAVINFVTRQNKDPLAELAIAGQFDQLESLDVRVIITSPSVIQGLSWEEAGRFSLVVGTFTGCSITPRQMRQSLARVRENITRIVWAAEHRKTPGKWGNELNPTQIKSRILAVAQSNQFALNGAISELSETRTIALDWAARLIAADNLWCATPADSLRLLLEEHGHTITPIVAGGNGETYKATAEAWGKEKNLALLGASVVAEGEATALRSKSTHGTLTASEQLSLERWELCKFYAIAPDELTLELIELDDDRAFRRIVRAFEHLYAPDGLEQAKQQTGDSLGLAEFDSDRAFAAAKLRTALGLKQIVELFQAIAVSQDHPALIAFAQKSYQQRQVIKTALNYTVSESKAQQNSSIKLVGELLEQIGLSLESSRARNTERKVIRLYSLNLLRWKFLNDVTERRYQQRMQAH